MRDEIMDIGEKEVKPTSNTSLMGANNGLMLGLLGCLEAKNAKIAISKVRDTLLRALIFTFFWFLNEGGNGMGV